jgi:hypothetical protein
MSRACFADKSRDDTHHAGAGAGHPVRPAELYGGVVMATLTGTTPNAKHWAAADRHAGGRIRDTFAGCGLDLDALAQLARENAARCTDAESAALVVLTALATGIEFANASGRRTGAQSLGAFARALRNTPARQRQQAPDRVGGRRDRPAARPRTGRST